jgi:hypothetical protein
MDEQSVGNSSQDKFQNIRITVEEERETDLVKDFKNSALRLVNKNSHKRVNS